MKTLLATVILFALTLAVLADETTPPQITPHTVATPGAVHPQAALKSIDADAHVVCFDWLDADGHHVDSGNSIAHYTATDPAAPTDAELAAAIEAVAPAAP